MEKSINKLPDNHLEEAKKIVQKHIIKSNCKRCYARGYEGINQENMLIPCSKCVDSKSLFKEWKEYVATYPELVELYGDSLEEKDEEETS